MEWVRPLPPAAVQRAPTPYLGEPPAAVQRAPTPELGEAPAAAQAAPTPDLLARVGFVGMPVCSVFRRSQSRRGGGGEERGGDACIAHPGRCKHPLPASAPPPPLREPDRMVYSPRQRVSASRSYPPSRATGISPTDGTFLGEGTMSRH